MAELRGERKVYSEFFTNLAVAWFAGGVITVLAARPIIFQNVLILVSMGLIGTVLSLFLATLVIKEKNDKH